MDAKELVHVHEDDLSYADSVYADIDYYSHSKKQLHVHAYGFRELDGKPHQD
jgi:hypothetical protein